MLRLDHRSRSGCPLDIDGEQTFTVPPLQLFEECSCRRRQTVFGCPKGLVFVVQDVRGLAGISCGNKALGNFPRHQPGGAFGRTAITGAKFTSREELDDTGSGGVNFLGE
jgi:hypothetical protein